MKKIEDFIHLYLGCKAVFNEEIWKLKSVELGINGNVCGRVNRKRPERVTYDLENFEFRNGSIPIKLLLRPLSSMQMKEMCDCGIKTMSIQHEMLMSDTMPSFDPDQFVNLLQRGFDLFGLIESGLALDATLITTNKTE